MARKRTLAAALATAGYLQVAPVWSMGLGDIKLESFLNEPLRASVSLLNTGNLHEDQIRVRLATSEDFDRLGVERAYFLTGIKFEVQVDERGNGRILLTSSDPVLEPYLDFIIEARWPSGRLLRNYTVLVDPPQPVSASAVRVSASDTLATREQAASSAEAPSTAVPVESAVSGDRVDVRRSDLPPGEMPRRNYGSDTAEAPAPGARYMIRRDETLWTIAQRARPEGVTVQQTMLEIQRLNPDAFIDGNINRIKAGYIIYLPASGDMSAADSEQVREQIRQQNADWRAGRPSDPAASQAALRLASASDAGEAADAATGPGEAPGAAPVQPSAAPAESSSETAAAQMAAAGPGESAQGREGVTRQELEQAELERDALSGQLAALGDRLSSLERMVEMRDAQIAELQAALAEAQSRPTVPATLPAAAETGVDTGPAAGGSGYWWYGLGAAGLAALVGLLIWRRREQAEADEPARPVASVARTPVTDAFAGVQLRDQEVELDLHEEMASAAPTISVPRAPAPPQRGYGERKHDQYAADVETSDALAEADIYIAYGRFPQALELLRKAVAADPDNAAYRFRLLELAVETGDRAEAEAQLARLRETGDTQRIDAAENLLLGGAIFEQLDSGEADQLPVSGMDASMDPEPAPGTASATRPAADVPEPAVPAAESHADDWLQPLEREDELADLSRFADSLDEQVPAVSEEEPEFLGLEIEAEDSELDLSRETGAASTRHASSEEDDFVFADDGDPVATRLDLARAYIDMGDDEGAREILGEVLATGNPEQQAEAQELLERLA